MPSILHVTQSDMGDNLQVNPSTDKITVKQATESVTGAVKLYDRLNSNDPTGALSSNMGKLLNDKKADKTYVDTELSKKENKTYRTLGELGLLAPATTTQIIKAMPAHSRCVIHNNNVGGTISDTPREWGTLIIEKTTDNNIISVSYIKANSTIGWFSGYDKTTDNIFPWVVDATSDDLDKKLDKTGGNITNTLTVRNNPVDCIVSYSAEQPGYRIHADGYKEAWGTVNLLEDEVERLISLPFSFSNKNYSLSSATETASPSADCMISIRPETNSSLLFRNNSWGGMFRGIGKWYVSGY